MKCPKCKIENPEEAKYCRNCGYKLVGGSFVSSIVMDRFPEYKFIPTNFIDWKKPWIAKIRTILFSIIFAVSLFMFCYSIASVFCNNSYVESISINYENTEYRVSVNDAFLRIYSAICYRSIESDARSDAEQDYKEIVSAGIIISGLISLISLIIIKFCRRKFPPKNNQLSNVADYVQKYRYTGFIRGRKPILKFYVKDNKMGLLDVAHYCVFLNAQYDKLEWREKNKLLKASLNNKTFIIDIHGKDLK